MKQEKCTACGADRSAVPFPSRGNTCRPCLSKTEKLRQRRLAEVDGRSSTYDRAKYQRRRDVILAEERAKAVADPTYNQRRHLKTYGLSLEDYRRIMAAQGNVCAICHTPPVGGRGNGFYVDHDHVTGKVRGLLCHCCNAMLGYAKDNVLTLESGVAYLQRSGS